MAATASLLFVLILALMRPFVAHESYDLYDRASRSFPYSAAIFKMLPPSQRQRPAFIVDAARVGEEDLSDLLRSIAADDVKTRKQKRYACRFKFCRIFDA